MERVAILLVLAMASMQGCLPPVTKTLTPAAVFRFEGPTFRHCQLVLGWTEPELTGACGRPVARIGGTGDEQCVLYESVARGLVDKAYSAAPYFVVCLTPVEDSGRSWQERRGNVPRVENPATHTMRVTGVFGLRAMPADFFAPPAAPPQPAPSGVTP